MQKRFGRGQGDDGISLVFIALIVLLLVLAIWM